MLRIKKQLPLSQQDKLVELWEDTDKKLEHDRIPNQENWTNPERARGNAIHSSEIILRVRKMNPDIFVLDSPISRERAGFYYISNGLPKFTGAHFQKGMVREHCLIYKDLSNRPTGYELGWREILGRLRRKGLISWEQMKRYFPIYHTQLSVEFDRQMQDLKN